MQDYFMDVIEYFMQKEGYGSKESLNCHLIIFLVWKLETEEVVTPSAFENITPMSLVALC